MKISALIEKGFLDNMTTKDKGKTAITAIKYSASDRAILFSFYNHLQPLWVWADGTSISHGKLNLHVDVRWGIKANIKGEVSNPKKGLRRKAKNQNLPGRTEEKNFSSEHGLFLYEHYDQPSSGDQGLAFQAHVLQILLFGLLTYEPNIILGSLQTESLQLAPSVGKTCALALHHFQWTVVVL